MWQIEQELWQRGITRIAGVDEAGRGPWAGPVVAAAVIIPVGLCFTCLINDSKKLSPRQRELACAEIEQTCQSAYAVISHDEIDRINILQASLLAMAQALHRLSPPAEHVLVDGQHIPDIRIPATAIIDGDAKSMSIACASIIAKVMRDRLMVDYDRQFPLYGFARHKGYGTQAHHEALRAHGPCAIHRRSFRPVRELLSS